MSHCFRRVFLQQGKEKQKRSGQTRQQAAAEANAEAETKLTVIQIPMAIIIAVFVLIPHLSLVIIINITIYPSIDALHDVRQYILEYEENDTSALRFFFEHLPRIFPPIFTLNLRFLQL